MAKKIIQFIIISIIFSLLLGFIITGWQSRYLADDYCYDAEFIQHGFWQGQFNSYMSRMPYSSNRYSLTLFSGIAWALGGVKIAPIIPGIVVLLWGTSLFFTINEGRKVAKKNISTLSILASAMVIVFFSLLLAPNRYQILYWRSGMLPYLFPLILNTFLLGFFFVFVKRDRVRIGGLIALGLISWVTAGFSETTFALQTSFWIMVLLCSLTLRKNVARNAAIAVLLGIFFGLLLLVLNPTNAIRQSAFPTPPTIINAAITSIKYTGGFVFDLIRSAPLPFIVLLFSGLLWGWVELRMEKFRWKLGILLLLGLLIGTYLLIASTMAPTVWAMSSFPDPRGLLPGSYLIIIVIFTLGVILGTFGNTLFRQRIPVWLENGTILILVAILSAYYIHLIPSIYSYINPYQARAKIWDARNEEILKMKTEGQTHILVSGITSISGIVELQKNKNYFINQCAAIYYGVEDIRTTE